PGLADPPADQPDAGEAEKHEGEAPAAAHEGEKPAEQPAAHEGEKPAEQPAAHEGEKPAEPAAAEQKAGEGEKAAGEVSPEHVDEPQEGNPADHAGDSKVETLAEEEGIIVPGDVEPDDQEDLIDP